MALTFDSAAKRIVLDSASTSAQAIYAAWADWMVLSDNAKHLPAFRTLGGDDLGGGLSVPPYYFLMNGWRVRPMEASQTLTVTGNLFVDGGGDAVVSTLGVFNVLTKLVVPTLAMGIATGGGSSPSAIAVQVRAELAAELLRILELAAVHGLVPGSALVVTPTTRVAGTVQQTITDLGGTVTVARNP